jgi:hypothetical protein
MSLEPGKLLRLYISEQDQYEGKPLYEAIVSRCQEIDVAGVTVFRGMEGFGHSSQIHRPHLFAHDQPIVITIAERPEKARAALAALQEMMPGGMIAVSDVELSIILNGRPAQF